MKHSWGLLYILQRNWNVHWVTFLVYEFGSFRKLKPFHYWTKFQKSSYRKCSLKNTNKMNACIYITLFKILTKASISYKWKQLMFRFLDEFSPWFFSSLLPDKLPSILFSNSLAWLFLFRIYVGLFFSLSSTPFFTQPFIFEIILLYMAVMHSFPLLCSFSW